jgi:putative DNA primase/helicase
MGPGVARKGAGMIATESKLVRIDRDSVLNFSIEEIIEQLIPPDLRRLGWLTYKLVLVEGEWKKLPRIPGTTQNADVTDPKIRRSLTDTLKLWRSRPELADALGLPTGQETRGGGLLTLIDGDGQGKDHKGALPAEFDDIFRANVSYAEWSVNHGGHLIGGVREAFGPPKKAGSWERYCGNRGIWFTGERMDGAPFEIRFIDDQARRVGEIMLAGKAKPMGSASRPAAPVNLDDDALIEKAKHAKNGADFAALFAGDTSRHGGDDSVADLALCGHLAFWTGRDATRMDRLFRMSGLYREKWEREDYRLRTVGTAIEGCSEVYDPSRNGNDRHKPRTSTAPIGADQAQAKAETANEPGAAATSGKGELLTTAEFTTDAGNGARFARKHAGKFLYSAERNSWLRSTGRRWEWDNVVAVQQAAVETALDLLSEARRCQDTDRRGKLIQWALESQSRRRTDAMIDMARPRMAVTIDQLDIDPWKLNVLNGTIDERTGELLPHDPADRITKLAPVNYDPDAACPKWDTFIGETFQNDTALIQFVQRYLGMCATGDVSDPTFAIFNGVGANGKSVLLDTFRDVLGDYAALAMESLITTRLHPEHACELAVLAGKRFVQASETDAESCLRLSLVKRVTGDSKLTARYMYGNPFEFHRTFKMALVTNHLPILKAKDMGEATWRRLKVIPFNHVVPEDKRDPQLLQKLRAEWPGVLAWIIRGCLDWQQHGLGLPDAVKLATSAYRQDQDTLGRFIEECCFVEPKAEVFSTELHRAYCQFCESTGADSMTQTALANPLKTRGFTADKCSQTRRATWKGIGLKA